MTAAGPGRLRRFLFGGPFPPGQPRPESGHPAEARWRDVYESSERCAGEVHRTNVSFVHERLVIIVGYANHQIAADDTAAHAALQQKRQTAEHLAFFDVGSIQYSADALGERLVVSHGRQCEAANGFSSALGPYTEGTGTSSKRR